MTDPQDMEAARPLPDLIADMTIHLCDRTWGEVEMTWLYETLRAAIAQARVDAERDTAKRVSEEADKRMASLQSEVATTRLHWKEAAKLLATDEAASLGFSANQAAAVAGLVRDRDALAAQVEELHRVLAWEHRNLEGTSRLIDGCEVCAALALSPAASLIAHDNALIERCAAALDQAAKQWSYLAGRGDVQASDKRHTYECAASMVRALKTDSEGSTT